MPLDLINLGSVANDRAGDPWRIGGTKINSMFTELFEAKDAMQINFIAQESDFPVQDATTITLEAQQIYITTAAITTAKSFTVKDAAVLSSLNVLGPALTYTGTGSMFNIIDASFTIREILVSHPSAQGYNFVDNVGGLFLMLIDKVRNSGGTKYGTFDNPSTLLIEGSSGLGMDAGLTMVGSSVVVCSIDKFFMTSASGTFIGCDLGTSISQILEFADFAVTAPAGAIGISGLANSGNVPVNRIATVVGCEFGGGLTTPLQNIQSSDVRWNFQGNTLIPDSRTAADVYMTGGSETITTGSAGDWQEIGIPSGGASWASDISDRFTIGTNGVATYIGEIPLEVRTSGRATVEKVGGGSNVLEVRLALNWDGTASDSGLEKSRAQTQNTDPTTVPIGALVSLVPGDNLRVIFSNVTGGSNIIASVSALEIFD